MPELSPAKNSSCILEPDDLYTAFPRHCSKQYYRELLAPPPLAGMRPPQTLLLLRKMLWVSRDGVRVCVRHEMGPAGNHKPRP